MEFVWSGSPQQLDLDLCLTCGQVFRWERARDGTWYGVDGDHWWRLQQDDGQVLVATSGTRSDFERLFRLEIDLDDLHYKLTSAAPELVPSTQGLAGLRLLRPSGLVETLFSFLCTPNNNVPRISKMVRSLATYGEPLTDTADGPTRFPSLESIAALTESELRDRGFGYRARTIPSVARQIMSQGGVPWLDQLRRFGYEKAFDALVGLNGIGPKLADCICLFAFDQSEAVPIDTHMWKAAVRAYFPEWAGGSLTDARYRQIGGLFRQKFGGLAGYAHHFFFVANLKQAARDTVPV